MFKILFNTTWVSAFYDTCITLTTLGIKYQNEPESDIQLISIAIYNIISTLLFILIISSLTVEIYTTKID